LVDDGKFVEVLFWLMMASLLRYGLVDDGKFAEVVMWTDDKSEVAMWVDGKSLFRQ